MFAGRRFTAVLFDMDGTLIDSTPAVVRCWKRFGDEYGLPLENFHGWHGVPAAQVLATMLPPELLAQGAARLEQIEVSDTAGIVVLPGAAAALGAIPPGRAAIATSCTMPLAEARIRATALPVPSVLVTADQVPVGKPDPAPYLTAARRLGVDPGDCLVVEDAPAGLAAARAAGCATLAVTTTHPADELDADEVVPGLADVVFEAGATGISVRGVTQVTPLPPANS